ncbi:MULTISPECIES: glycerophosphoryl diester phosphodiesterase membrane domain-containing protein [unclassified Streptomyces]|uniref:glycerophosphoryl diester phosphodiesterase membrane domain-containing protein n=1 Tax=unclassified Streptomyces TaxID=2593676 RepID=UPI0036AED0BC
MNDTPGWTSPGSAPSDGQDGSGIPRPTTPADANGSAPQWSKDQPPAGQWTPPTAQTPPPTPGRNWGAPPPNAHWGRPPAAKPGVIPLRPLGMGEILDGSAKTLRTYWRTVLSFSVTVAVISQIANILAQRYLVPVTPALSPDATPAEQLDYSIQSAQDSLVGLAPALLVTLVASLVSAALLTVVISRAVVGRPVSLGEAWREARPRLLQLFGLTFLLVALSVGIVTVGLLPGFLIGGALGAALTMLGGLASMVATVWLIIRFSLASPALMLERQGVTTSLKRSAKLVQGSWWRIFGITLLTQLLIFVFAMIVSIPFLIVGIAVDGEGFSGLLTGSTTAFGWPFLIVTGIGSVLASAVTYPISAGVTVLLYVDQRIRREALDLDLARAAGLPGYGPTPGDETVEG